jgi:hypothetical protein
MDFGRGTVLISFRTTPAFDGLTAFAFSTARSDMQSEHVSKRQNRDEEPGNRFVADSKQDYDFQNSVAKFHCLTDQVCDGFYFASIPEWSSAGKTASACGR